MRRSKGCASLLKMQTTYHNSSLDSIYSHNSVDVLPPIACHGVTRDSMFGLQHMRNSTLNARDSRFILVQTLDR